MFAKTITVTPSLKGVACINMETHPKILFYMYLQATKRFEYKYSVTIDDVPVEISSIEFMGEYTTLFLENNECYVDTDSVVAITLTFWDIGGVSIFNGSENIRKDDWNMITNHWIFGIDGKFHIDTSDPTVEDFIKFMKPEWRFIDKDHRIETNTDDDNIIDVEDFVEINENALTMNDEGL